MSMTKGEAIAVQSLLDWVLSLAVFEHGQDVGGDVLPDVELVRVAGLLADRSSAVLGAGLRQGEAIEAARKLLGLPS